MMSIRNRNLIASVVLIAVLSIGWGYAQPGPTRKGPSGEVPEKDYLQEMIELVVEANPTLQLQRSLIKEIEAVPEPVKGVDLNLGLRTGARLERVAGVWDRGVLPTASLDLIIPLYSSAKQRKIALDRLRTEKDLARAWYDYFRFKNSIVSDLLTRVDRIVSSKNELEGQKKILSLHQHRVETLKKEVEAGIVRLRELWEVRVRIITTETKIQNFSSKLNTLKRETALKLAGDRWQELMKMLGEITNQER